MKPNHALQTITFAGRSMKTELLLLIAGLLGSSAYSAPSSTVEFWELTEPPLRQSGDGTAYLLRALLWSTPNTRKAYSLLPNEAKGEILENEFSQEVVKHLEVSESSFGSGMFSVTLGDTVLHGQTKIRALIAAARGDQDKVVISGAAHPYRIKTEK